MGVLKGKGPSVSQPASHPTKQPTSQSTKQPANQPTNQSINISINQSCTEIVSPESIFSPANEAANLDLSGLPERIRAGTKSNHTSKQMTEIINVHASRLNTNHVQTNLLQLVYLVP